MNKLADEVLEFVAKNGTVSMKDIYDTFNVTKETADIVIDFLVQFGFLEFDKKRKYISLSEASRSFFE